MISVDFASAFWILLRRRADDVDDVWKIRDGPFYVQCGLDCLIIESLESAIESITSSDPKLEVDPASGSGGA